MPGRSKQPDAKPPDAGGAVQGARDRAAGSDPPLSRGGGPDLPGQDRQNALPGAARRGRRRPATALGNTGKPLVPPEPLLAGGVATQAFQEPPTATAPPSVSGTVSLPPGKARLRRLSESPFRPTDS